jgi:CheY-like chemotaxis protein
MSTAFYSATNMNGLRGIRCALENSGALLFRNGESPPANCRPQLRPYTMKRPHRIRILGGDHRGSTAVGKPPSTRLGSRVPDNRLPESKTARKTILLVEDDPHVREFGILALRGGGYEVVSADSASQARRIWERERGKIDVLVTDMMIPNCSTGLELARCFRQENAALPVIITSGFGPEIAGDQAMELQTLAYLRKPFKVEELLRVVSNSLRATVR